MDFEVETMISDDPEDIVISGIAGKFPESENMKVLQENLLNKVDLGTDDTRRWIHQYPDVPPRTGKIDGLNKFDADYFNIPDIESHQIDVSCRILLENTYEAIIDAGINPHTLYGTNLGVFVGACYTEAETDLCYDKAEKNTIGVLGYSKALLANRISHWLGVTGPSHIVDSACSSSFIAIDRAYRSIRSGYCDAAIVASANLCFNPQMSLQFSRLGVLSKDGRCKVFDDAANGYMRSETIAVMYLQKLKDAKRVYATVTYTKTNSDGYKEQGITFPSARIQGKLLEEFYNECDVPITSLNYFEAHGTGTFVGDFEELKALEKYVCRDRKTPLLVGSVKSNLGHSEPPAGSCQVAKVIIAMETGIIPPNLHFKKGRRGIKALENGDIRVVAEPTPWKPGYVGINSFGFGGANVHVLLRANSREKINNGLPNDQLPRLIVMSGRTEDAIESFFNEIESRPMDVEYFRLLHNIFATDIPNHPYRGYAIIERETSFKPIKEIQRYSGIRQPICFVFSGIGSQWRGMGRALMQFPAFSKVVENCQKILRPYGIHIVELLTNEQKSTCNTILDSLVGITVMQIGLIELLKSINITPDYTVGYSIGELCCGYIADTFTTEQVILSAYYMGLALNESNIISGAMMYIEHDYEKVKSMCASDIEISRFSSKICCISGPKESVKAFAAKLQANNVRIKEIDCVNIPLHSHYLFPAKAKLHAYLTKIIPQKMTNHHLWTSSLHNTKLSHDEYFTNTLLSPVAFEELVQRVPQNVITIEIGSDEILQNVMKEYSDTNITLMQRTDENNVKVFLQGLGKMYNTGSQMEVANLYPAVQFPVSRGTPMISPFLKWDHSEDWYVTTYMQKTITSGEELITISLTDEEFDFMNGHVIDGRILLPATGYLFLVWETIGKLKRILHPPVVFEDVKFLRATQFQKRGTVELTIMLQKGTGRFEIIESGSVVVAGTIRIPQDVAKEKVPQFFLQQDNGKREVMKLKDIYKELRLRGYQYSGAFRGITSASSMGEQGHLTWAQNWMSFMDCMLQLKILGMDTNNLYVPTGIRKLVIDPKLHAEYIQNLTTDDTQFPVYVYKDYDTVISVGVEMRGITASSITRRKTTATPVLERYEFVPHRDRSEISFHNAMILSMHLIVEYCQVTKLNIIEIIESSDQVTTEELASPIIADILHNLPLIQPNINLVARTDRFDSIDLPSSLTKSDKLSKDNNAVLVIGFDLFNESKSETLTEALQALKTDGFLLTRGEALMTKEDRSIMEKHNLVVVLEKRTKQEYITLLRTKPQFSRKTEVVRINNYEFSWLEDLKAILKAHNESRRIARILLVGEKDPECGLLGFVNCLRKEPGGELIRGVLIQDETAPNFSLQDPLYAQQLERDLIINVLRPGKIWGSYRHLPLQPLALKPVHHAFVNQQVRGNLNSFCWLQGEILPEYQDRDIVRIIYASINFRDVMITTGKVNMDLFASRGRLEECFIGMEYVGIDNSGHRVMGLCENKSISNMLEIDRSLCWNIPDDWTFEDAATVPCAYSTCYYALHLRGNMKKGDKILIHSGTGAVGQAAIYLSLHAGCEIFTTVGTPEKRKFILETFPSIPESHIGNSRDTSFEQMILQQTNGRGVDIVLNSLAEEKLQASVRCVARGGCFLEIGKFDFMANNLLDLSILSKELKFFSIMLDNVFVATKEEKRNLAVLINEGLKKGAITPLCHTVFQKDEIETAFRYMAAGKHIGKIILKIQEEDKDMNAPILALPRYYCSKRKSYVILGGLGGFGLELTDWLITRGARNLVLVSRNGLKNGYQHRKVQIWKSYGINILIMSNVDASTASGCDTILNSAEKLAPVDAIFNLAVVLNDKLYQNHTVETFEEPFKGKAWATKHLDQASRKLCPQLRHFVIFSSVSCGRGNSGQTNYGMANSIMERICEKRSLEGLHGLAIQWGAIGDVGIVADMMDRDREMIIGGTLQQKINSCLEKLEEFLLQEYPVVASMVVAEKQAHLSGVLNVAEAVAHIMDIKNLKVVAPHTPLSELGMDSIMAVEIKNILEREYDIFLTAQDIRTLTFAKLSEMCNKDEQVENSCSKSANDTTEVTGIKLIIRVVGDEPFTRDVCTDFPTKRTNTESEVFLIPGLEGCKSIFNPLVQEIEATSATCLQHGTYMVGPSCTSINEIADCLLQHILDQKKMEKNFVIIAYSFGALIGIELIRRLEARNFKGRLILIDGAPDQMKAMRNQFFYFSAIEELQNNVLLAVMDNIEPTSSGKLFIDLKNCSSWDEKLDAFIYHLSLLKVDTRFSLDMRKAFGTTIYKHILAIHQYDATQGPKITSPVTLLKPTKQSISFPEEDYGLLKLTDKNVEIKYVKGNHLSILENSNILDIINGIINS